MRFGVSIVGLGASVLLAACSAADRPPAADFAGEVPAPPVPTGSATPNEPTTDAGKDASAEDSCPPRSKRECMTTFRTVTGQVQTCSQSIQWCRADGTGWHKCGFSVEKPPD
ncbi:MAG: hypothetical protein JST00_43550 [Deltaproteobacteria bacterium]|nr:hypothetical protein [Deltaproteobacteria bacterium]